MKKVFIKYDPYEMKTVFEIDGKSVAENKYKPAILEQLLNIESSMPLQSWIDPIPSENWDGLLSFLRKTGDDEFSVSFFGRKSDFEDLKKSLEAQDDGNVCKVNYPDDEQKFIIDDWEMKKTVDEVIDEISKERFEKLVNASFNKTLKEKYRDMRGKITDINNKEFRIVFTGTYSTGKSTLINALLGKNILPSSIDSCTDLVCYIKHSSEVKYVCVKYIKNNDVKKSFECNDARTVQEIIKAASSESPDRVEVYTDLGHLYPDKFKNEFTLVLVDTPGTESEEGGEKHLHLTEDVLASDSKEMVILVSDHKTVSSGITRLLDIFENSSADDRSRYNDRFLFVLNHCDKFEYRNGQRDLNGNIEGLENEINKFKETIKKSSHGTENKPRNISNPRVFPVSAAAALAVRINCISAKPARGTEERAYYDACHSLYEKLTDNDDFNDKINKENISPDYALNDFSGLSQEEKNKLNMAYGDTNNKENYMLLNSGILALECAIRSYIEKYAIPLKIKKLLKTFKSIITEIKEENTFYCNELEKQNEKLRNHQNTIREEQAQESKEKNNKEKLEIFRKQLDELKNKVEQVKTNLPEIDEIRKKYNEFERESKDFFPKDQEGNVKLTQKQAEDIMRKIIDSAKVFSDQIKDIVEDIRKRKQTECDNYLKELNESLKIMESEGLLNIGAFDIRNTVAYQDIIKNESIFDMSPYLCDSSSEWNGKRIENGMFNFLSRMPKMIIAVFSSFCVPETIATALVSKMSRRKELNVNEYIGNLYPSINAEVSRINEDIKKSYENDLDVMQKDLTDRIDTLWSLIAEMNNHLKEKANMIEKDLKTEEAYCEKKKALEDDNAYLRGLVEKLDISVFE